MKAISKECRSVTFQIHTCRINFVSKLHKPCSLGMFLFVGGRQWTVGGPLRERIITYANRWDCITCLIFSIPVAAIKSGSWKGGFSIPLFPCKINKNKNYEMQTIHVYITKMLCGQALLIIKQWRQEEFSPGIKHSETYLKIQSITISTLVINKCPMELHKKGYMIINPSYTTPIFPY
jgi:hypothetical protein